MEKLLTEIERSEFNNPLLTAALAEVDKLTLLVSQIRCLVENEKIKCEENGQVRLLTGKEADAAKIEILTIMLYPYD